ncbi:MAG: ABC transporter ATP-binding protein [Pseudoxanthomonas sp.]|nr:ABC transporter ATP-binding protein [Pseudoxanthomonas sp.]
MSTIIQARGLSKSFGATRALDQVSFTVPSGRIVGLIGPNGAGKTTALKAILGLTPYQGELKVLGLDPHTQRQQLMQDVCFIADTAILPRWIRVRELIDFVERVHPRFSRARCEALLAKTKIARDMKVKAMSKGMVVQMHLAIVMAIDARLLVLDEPTLGLDILHRKAFYEALLNDYFDHDKTILVTTHQVEEIEHILSDVMFIQDGRIVLDAAMDTLPARFAEVLVNPDQRDQARALGPLHERSVFGKSAMLFDGVGRDRLAAFGEVRSPGLADLFVAIMKEKQQ